MKENIIKKLTCLPFIINNDYLKQYIEIVSIKNTQAGYQELHHIICKSFSKALNEPVDNSADNLVSLLFKDHCKAHWLLYKCTTGDVKAAMANAFVSMIAFKKLSKDTLLTFGLNEDEYNELQLKVEELRQDKTLNYWKAEDDEFLIKNYASKGQRYCAEHLGRSLKTVSSRASDLGIIMDKWWTNQEKQFLIDNNQILNISELAAALNRTEKAIISKLSRLNLTPADNYTEEELQFLTTNYTIYGHEYCAQLLNRTTNAIKRKASYLKLPCPQGSPIYCPELDRIFISISAAAKELNLSDGNICQVVQGKAKATRGYSFIKLDRKDYYEKRTSKN